MIIKDTRKFSGITIAEPFIRGKLIGRTKQGDEIRLKRYLVIGGKYGNIPLRFNIVQIPRIYETFESARNKIPMGYEINPAHILNPNAPKYRKKIN